MDDKMSSRSLEPDWFSKPSHTIRHLLSIKGLSIEDFAQAGDIDVTFARALVIGTARIDDTVAAWLSNCLGGSQSFWLKRQKNYEVQLAEAAKRVAPDEARRWLSSLPLSEMRSKAWISAERHEALSAALSYFDVASPGDWIERYVQDLDKYLLRTSETYQSSTGSLVAWLRQSELEAELVKCAKWNAGAFVDSLKEIKTLTKSKNIRYFIKRLREISARCGVAVVFVEAPKGCRASGATRFVSKEKALISLSFRYLSDDHFWFTFFHEAGHLILHEPCQVFIEGSTSPETTDKRESEANLFARQMLVPDERIEDLVRIKPKARDIIRMSVSLGVSPGIVVGQLQKLNVISHSQLNFLKRRFTWAEIRSALD